MLCRVAAVKSLPLHHHSAGYILFPFWNHWAHSGYFENQIPLKLALGGICSLANYSVAYEETQTECPIFVILCVLCFKGNSFNIPPYQRGVGGWGWHIVFWTDHIRSQRKTFCLLCNLNTLWNILMILGRNVNQDKMTCHIQDWQLWLSYFLLFENDLVSPL